MAIRRKGALVAISLSTCLVTAILTTGGSEAYASGPEQAQPGAIKTAVHTWPSPWVSGKPEIVAHRGDSTAATPNTPGAIRAALDHGADAVEFDVQWTKDGQPIVLHDSHLSTQTTNCKKRTFEIDYTEYRTCKTKDGKTAPNAYEALLPVRDAG